MHNHKEVIDWYIQREVRASESNPAHEEPYLARLLNEPKKEIRTINKSLDNIILEATKDLNYVPRIYKRSFASELVSACRQYFLGTDD